MSLRRAKRRSRRTALRVLLVAVFGASAVACGGNKDSKVPETDLPRWEGQLQDLFDDHINPAAVGLSMDGQSPATDPMLRPRAQQADVVARMKVQTVTRDSVGAKTTYVLTLQVGSPTLMPAKLEDASFELSINQSSNAFGIVQQLDTSLRGTIFIGFIRKFQGLDGPEIHWHLTADTQEVAQVIQEIAVLDEVAGDEAPE